MNNVIATLVAVVVTLLLIVVAVVIGEQLFTGGNAQKAISEYWALHQAVESLMVGQNLWPNQDLTAALASSGLAPTDMISGGSLYDPWGGGVGVSVGGNGGNPQGSYIQISFGNVPNADCVQMLVGINIPCGQGWIGAGTSELCGSITPAAAQAACTSGNNTVVSFLR